MRVFGWVIVLGLAAVLIGCGDSTGPITGAPPAAMSSAALTGNNGNGFGNHEPIHLVPTAPGLAARHAQFWAVQGKQRSVTISYLPEHGEREGKLFLKFTVSAKTQLMRPDGSLVARGDSVLIGVDVMPGELAAEFSPAGLRFGGGTPAELGMSFYYGDTRGRPTNQLGIWYEPVDGAPAEWVPSAVNPRGWMVIGLISHFSNYAVAY